MVQKSRGMDKLMPKCVERSGLRFVGTIRRRKTSLGPLGMKIQEGEQPALEAVCVEVLGDGFWAIVGVKRDILR